MYMEPFMSSASLLILFFLLLCVAVIIALRDTSHQTPPARVFRLVRGPRRSAKPNGRKGFA